MTSWPDASVQGLVDFDWWVPVENPKSVQRGQIVRAFIPHADQSPFTLVPEGRDEPTDHDKVKFSIAPTHIGDRRRTARLPVAALPLLAPTDVWAVYRAKVRPCLVISIGGPEVRQNPSAASWQTFPTLTLAPYFGVDQSGSRGGWNEAFVERIRRVEYPQYIWDQLPIGGRGPVESILRLDQAQPVGRNYNSIEPLPWMLSADALAIVEEWQHWLNFERWPGKKVVALRELRNVLRE